MNDIQRSVLQRHIKQLGDDIMLTEELLSAMFQRRIFERSMIETIRAERTHTDQVYKMLSMLPKRGPEAFEAFVDIIKTDYPWLAATLDMNYKTEADNMMLSRQSSFNTVCTCGNASARGGESIPDGPKPPVIEVQADGDVKTKVGMFIHKQFGHSKRISQQDKKVMERWLSEQIQGERKSKLAKGSISEEPEMMERESFASPVPDPAYEDIKRVFEKVRDENLSDLLNSEHTAKHIEEENENASDEVDAGSCADSSIEPLGKMASKLESEVDKLINRMNQVEGMLTQCHYILGDPDRKQKLPTLVKDHQNTSRQLEKDVCREKIKAEKMLHEIYDYSKSIHKLENDKLHQRQEFEKVVEQVEQLKRENAVLSEKCKTLEDCNLQHLEKEKTLQNLRKMVDDLKCSHTSLVDENSNYRINYGTGNFASRALRRSVKVPNRRGSTVESATTAPNPARKPLVNRTTLSTNRKKQGSFLTRYP